MPVSTALYAIEGGFDEDDLVAQLSEVQLERSSEHAEGPLRTKFTDVSQTTNGVSCVVQFELESKRSGWDGVAYERERQQSRIRFTNSIADGGVLVIAKADHQDEIASRLLDFFSLGPDPDTSGDTESLGIIRINISESELEDILEDDAAVESRATYDSIDENTDSASLAGVLDEAKTADEFDRRGDKRWVIFESKSFERKVGITVKNNAAVFWGDWDDAEMERYWTRIILPNLG